MYVLVYYLGLKNNLNMVKTIALCIMVYLYITELLVIPVSKKNYIKKLKTMSYRIIKKSLQLILNESRKT